MKNILLIMPYGSVGGMERLALNFYEHYKSLGYTVKAIKLIRLPSDIIHFGSDEIALSEKDFSNMSFVERFWFYCTVPFAIRRVIKENRISHSISFGDMANIFSSLSFTSEYKIASIHSLKSVEFVGKSFLNTVFKLGFKTSYLFFDKVVCISEAIKNDLIENCGFRFKKKLTVIYNPHNISQIERISEVPLDSELEQSIFGNKVILFLGRISIQKAPWHLMKAFSLLDNPNNELKLVLIGDGDPDITDYLNGLSNRLGVAENIVFLGRRSNPYQYLSRSAVLALSSYYEGTPNVIVEAIATGTPVVSSLCTDGVMELMSTGRAVKHRCFTETEAGLITPNFYKGSLAIPDDESITIEERYFASALLACLTDGKYKENLVRHRTELLEKFDLDKVAKSYLAGVEAF